MRLGCKGFKKKIIIIKFVSHKSLLSHPLSLDTTLAFVSLNSFCFSPSRVSIIHSFFFSTTAEIAGELTSFSVFSGDFKRYTFYIGCFHCLD